MIHLAIGRDQEGGGSNRHLPASQSLLCNILHNSVNIEMCLKLKKNLLLHFHIYLIKKQMHGMVHDVHVDFSQNWEIHGPWVGVQAQGQGKYGHVVTL